MDGRTSEYKTHGSYELTFNEPKISFLSLFKRIKGDWRGLKIFQNIFVGITKIAFSSKYQTILMNQYDEKWENQIFQKIMGE